MVLTVKKTVRLPKRVKGIKKVAAVGIRKVSVQVNKGKIALGVRVTLSLNCTRK